MKTRLFALVVIGCFCSNASAQTADQWVSQGRSYLAAKDMVNANHAFAQALVASPTNQTANMFHAATRLLQLPGQPAGSNFLTRIGISIPGRNIYNWQAEPPVDPDGIVIAPVGVDANEFTAQLRNNVLPEIAGSIANLAAITDTNFLVNLTSEETAVAAVTVDYGDLKLIQAALYGVEYVIYLLNAQNADIQLTAARSLALAPATTAQGFLAEYPQLLTFATTNDLWSARAAFSNAVNAYMTASTFIRNRPESTVRLFNYDTNQLTAEADFRTTLMELLGSLSGPQMLTLATNYSVCLSNQFVGKTAWRSLLPEFSGDDILLGSFPDLTFGGLVFGVSQEDVEAGAANLINMLPVGGRPTWRPDGLQLPFTTVRNHYYVLQMSTDLINWSTLYYLSATSSITTFFDPQAGSSLKRFYRVRDDSAYFAFAGTVLNQVTGLPIAGATVLSNDGRSAATDINGNFYLVTILPVGTKSIDYLQISADGYGTGSYEWNYTYDHGSGLLAGLTFYLTPL